MNKFLIIGDLHLGKGLSLGKPAIGTFLNGRVVDQLKLLDWILETAIENDIEAIFFTGDIFEDTKPDFNLVNLFCTFLKRCTDFRLQIHIVYGNHDIKRIGSYYLSVLDVIESFELENVFTYNEIKTVHYNGISFTFVPFRDRNSLSCDKSIDAIQFLKENIQLQLSQIPNNHDKILIGHLAFEGSLPFGDEIDDERNELMCPLDIFQGYDYVWMGHIHPPQIKRKSGPYLAHIGSIDISDFGEADHIKKIILYETNALPRFKEIAVPSRSLFKIEIAVPAQVDQTTEYILNKIDEFDYDLNESIVRIEITFENSDYTSIKRDVIENVLYQKHHVHYITNIIEIRTPIILNNNTNNTQTDELIDPKVAIKLWADQNLTDIDKSDYNEYALNVLQRYQEGIKK